MALSPLSIFRALLPTETFGTRLWPPLVAPWIPLGTGSPIAVALLILFGPVITVGLWRSVVGLRPHGPLGLGSVKILLGGPAPSV